MGVFDVLAQSFEIVKNNPIVIVPYFLFAVLIAIIAVVFVASFLVTSPALQALRSLNVTGGAAPPSLNAMIGAVTSLIYAILPVLALIFVISLLIGILVVGIYLNMADQGMKTGKVSLQKAFNVAKSRYLSLLGANIIVLLINVVVVGALVSLILLASGALAARILLGIIIIIYVIVAGLLFFQVSTAVVVENRGALDAVKRSIEIGKANWGAIFWTVVALVIVSCIVSLLITGIAVVLDAIPIVGKLVASVINFVFAAALDSWAVMIPVVFYYNYVNAKKNTVQSTQAGAMPKRRASRK